jgi:PAS domain S-box-containing protein
MDNHLRILIVEDSENDVDLVVRQLEKANYSVEFERVETAERMGAALAHRSWDFVFSDYTMPQFSAFAALKLLQESGQDIPFIVISGTIAEETAVEIMRLGAHDYLMKDKLARLASVVKRESEDSRARNEGRLTEKALRESEARFRALIETARDVIFSLTPDGKINTLNPSFEVLTGWPTAEWIGRSFAELLIPEDVPKALERFSKVVAGEPNIFAELRVQTKCRGVIHAEVIATRHVQNGELIELLGIARDITERKEAEIKLRRNEALLSDAMSIARLGPWEQDVATDTYIFNDHFYAIFHTTAEEVGGYTMSSAEYVRRFVHPDDAAWVKREIEEALASPDLQISRHLEHRMLYANGKTGYLDVSIFVVKDENGRMLRRYGVNQDITERKMADEQLRQSEERYRQFFEDDLTGDFISTVDGKILSCNPAFARIYGFDSVEEVLRTNSESFYLSSVDRDSFLALLREKRKLEYYEEVVKRKDGKMIYLISNEIGIFNDRGELVQIKGYIFDDTERRLLEDQLRQSQKMESIGTLAGGIAHDFNNILNNILGFVMQLKKYAHDPVKVMKYGETIERSATRGAELSAHLLSVARMKKREETEFDIGSLIHEITNLCTETFPRTVIITKVLGENLVPVKGDRGSLYQVLLNLTVNARDAMSNGGTLTIEARNRIVGSDVNPRLLLTEAKRCIEIKVADTGCGMSEAVREKIFDPFFTTKDQGKGTGLGLSIVYNIVKEHHGTILVESEEGLGTTFRVYLPAVEPAPVHDELSGGSIASHGELVLLVDDEEMMQELGRELLEDNGYKVLIAKDGVEAVEQYRERGKEIDLVILDLVMPRMDGGQTYMELKKINNNVKAFFCSGFTSDKVITQLLEEEHLHAIKKPFHPTDFIAMVQSTLHGG